MGEGVCDLEVLSVRLRGAGGQVNGLRLVCGPACDGACLERVRVWWANGGWWLVSGPLRTQRRHNTTVGSKGVEAGAWLPATEHVEDMSPYALNAIMFDKGCDRSSACR